MQTEAKKDSGWQMEWSHFEINRTIEWGAAETLQECSPKAGRSSLVSEPSEGPQLEKYMMLQEGSMTLLVA